MIIFKNDGVIDVKAIKTFGVSVKKDDAIGFFGTGLKYAIAILLREGCKITIKSGGKKYDFKKKNVKVTGENFEIVTMNNRELGFTTELGKTWKLWQAYRELHCNCTDEGGEVFDSDISVDCKKGETVIEVAGKAFEKIYEERELFILESKPNLENKYIEIRNKPTTHCFYKGVMVKDDMRKCLFTYNIKQNIDLTEDRTAKYSFDVMREICRGIVSLECEDTIERILTAPDGTYEAVLDYECYVTPSQKFIDVCISLAQKQSVTLNKCAVEYVKKYVDDNTEPKEVELSKMEESMYRKSCELLGLAGFNVIEFPVVFVETLGTGVFAQAKNGKMYLAKPCFEEGTKTVAHALLEEHFHLKHGYKDCERSFQTFLFKNILTLVERLNQEAF